MKYISITILLFLGLSLNAQTLKDCSQCGTQLIKESQLKDLGGDDAQLFINEIYARKGYTFSDPAYQHHFQQKSWYRSLNDNSKVNLTDLEDKNVDILRTHRKELNKDQELMKNALVEFKEDVLNGDKEILASKYKIDFEDDIVKENFEKFQENIKYLFPEDIHFHNLTGLFSADLDNGSENMISSIMIDKNHITFMNGIGGRTRLVENSILNSSEFADDYGEYAFYFYFEYKYYKESWRPVFKGTNIAG